MKTRTQAKSSLRKRSALKPADAFTIAVKQLLIVREESITDLARRIGYARNTVSRVINHPSIHPKVRREIEKDLQLAGAN